MIWRSLLALGATIPMLAAADEVKPLAFLDQHCMECHDADTEKGDISLESLFDEGASEMPNAKIAHLWNEVLDQLALGEMPPKKKPQPEKERLLAMTGWIRGGIADFVARGESTEQTVLRRLNKQEYRYTMEGFDNIGKALTVSPTLFERYLEAAEIVTTKALVTGPKPERKTKVTTGWALDCELGIRRGTKEKPGGIEIASNRVNRARVFPKVPVALEGRYRLKFHVKPVRSSGKKLGVTLKTGLADRELTIPMKQVEVFELTKETTFETELFIPENETVHISYNNGSGIPTISVQKNYKGPAVIISKIEIDGPLIAEWPPASHKLVMSVGNGEPTYQNAQVILRHFARRAFRRPPTKEMMEPLLATFSAERQLKSNFTDAIRSAIQVGLCSPHFLYVNAAPADSGKSLSDWELASRLSYFLWSSVPDETLAAAAKSGELSTPAGLEKQTRRMLADPKAERFVTNFVGQWLKTREVGKMAPDPKLFPKYDEALEAAMREETERFVGHLLANNLSIFNVLNSNWTFANERLARHYGIPEVKGKELRRVSLPPKLGRGGVLGHASFLTVTSNGTNTSPVVRGIYILENLLGTPPPPPPPDIEPIEPDTRGTTTIREQLAKHRDVATCNDCHQRIDPLGFALESWDPIGSWRKNYWLPGKKPRKGPAVATDTETADGQPLAGSTDLKKYLLQRKHLYAHALTEKLAIYATGRKPTLADDQDIEQLAKARTDWNNSGFQALVIDLVKSDAFKRR